MIIGADRKKLEEEKQNIYYKLLNATNSKDITIDEINALFREAIPGSKLFNVIL